MEYIYKSKKKSNINCIVKDDHCLPIFNKSPVVYSESTCNGIHKLKIKCAHLTPA